MTDSSPNGSAPQARSEQAGALEAGAQEAGAQPAAATADLTARLLLAAASLPADPGELALLSAQYPQRRADVDALYAVPAARYADPALRFRAGATIEEWARPAGG